MEQPQVEVSDMIVKSIDESVKTTMRLFNIPTVEELAPFTKVVLACRSLGGGAHEEVIAPIVNGILDNLGLDVKKDDERAVAANFAEMIAMSISDATQLIYQQMQQEAQQRAHAQAALQSGQGGLLAS